MIIMFWVILDINEFKTNNETISNKPMIKKRKQNSNIVHIGQICRMVLSNRHLTGSKLRANFVISFVEEYFHLRRKALIFYSTFKFTAKMRRKYRITIYPLPSHMQTSPIINIPHQNGTFIKTC